MADPVIQKYTPQIVTGEPGLKWVLTVSMGFYIGEGQARKAIYAKLYGPTERVRLKIWLCTSPDLVLGAEIISASSSGNRKAKNNVQPIHGRCTACGYEIAWALISS